MASLINTETQLCISLASRPGNFGNTFHNFLYQELGLNFLYKSCRTKDLKQAIAGLRALGIRGCGVSMPYKEQALEFCDVLDESVKKVGALNTIVNTDGRLVAYNTDFIAMKATFESIENFRQLPLVVLGSGGMARAVLGAAQAFGKPGVLMARANKAEALGRDFGFEWRRWGSELPASCILVNATSVGMAPKLEEMPIAESEIKNAQIIVDVVANPRRTQLIDAAMAQGKTCITGFEITLLQARRQFELYTGVAISDLLFKKAEAICTGS